MAAHTPEMRISELPYMIQFQRLNIHFPDQATQLDYCRDWATWEFAGNQRWRPLTRSTNDITYISQLVDTIAIEFQRQYPKYQGWATRLDCCGDCPTCGLVENQGRRPLTGSRKDITYISACIHNSYEIPTASLGAEINTFQLWMWPSWILHFWVLPLWLYSVVTCAMGMPTLKNIGIAVKITLLSSLGAEIR